MLQIKIIKEEKPNMDIDGIFKILKPKLGLKKSNNERNMATNYAEQQWIELGYNDGTITDRGARKREEENRQYGATLTRKLNTYDDSVTSIPHYQCMIWLYYLYIYYQLHELHVSRIYISCR